MWRAVGSKLHLNPVLSTSTAQGLQHRCGGAILTSSITPQRPQRGLGNLCWFLAHAFPFWPPALNLKTSYTSNPEPCQGVRRQTCTCT